MFVRRRIRAWARAQFYKRTFLTGRLLRHLKHSLQYWLCQVSEQWSWARARMALWRQRSLCRVDMLQYQRTKQCEASSRKYCFKTPHTIGVSRDQSRTLALVSAREMATAVFFNFGRVNFLGRLILAKPEMHESLHKILGATTKITRGLLCNNVHEQLLLICRGRGVSKYIYCNNNCNAVAIIIAIINSAITNNCNYWLPNEKTLQFRDFCQKKYK